MTQNHNTTISILIFFSASSGIIRKLLFYDPVIHISEVWGIARQRVLAEVVTCQVTTWNLKTPHIKGSICYCFLRDQIYNTNIFMECLIFSVIICFSNHLFLFHIAIKSFPRAQTKKKRALIIKFFSLYYSSWRISIPLPVAVPLTPIPQKKDYL